MRAVELWCFVELFHDKHAFRPPAAAAGCSSSTGKVPATWQAPDSITS